MTGSIDPTVVDGAIIFASLLVDHTQYFLLFFEAG